MIKLTQQFITSFFLNFLFETLAYGKIFIPFLLNLNIFIGFYCPVAKNILFNIYLFVNLHSSST